MLAQGSLIANELIRVIEFVAQAVWGILPIFLLSVFLGVLIRALKLDGAIRRAFDSRVMLAIPLATAVGAFSPFCSCTVVPIIAGLLVAGVPLAPVMSFWVASPTMDPEIFALSVGFLGWPLAVTRLVATLLLSFGAGYLTLALTRGGLLQGSVLRRAIAKRYGEKETREFDECCETTTVAPESSFVTIGSKPTPKTGPASCGLRTDVTSTTCSSCGCSGSSDTSYASKARWWEPITNSFRRLKWPRIGREMLSQSWSLGRWLLLAFVVEAIIVLYVPQEAIAGVLGENNAFAVPLAALIGVPLYLQNVGALPIVSGLLQGGMQPGAAITFLIAGSVTTIPAMVAIWGLVRPRVFALYVGIGLVGASLLGFLTNMVL